MKATSISAQSTVELRDVPIPRITNYEILVHMKTCGICGTDLEKVHGDHITPPVLGHEVAGEVEETGRNVHDFKKGDRVAVHHHISCRSCYFCKNSLETLCGTYPKSNLDPCGFAEYFRVPETLVRGGTVYRLQESMSYEEGSQIEPTACCVRALMKAGVRAGDSAAIFGVGPVGLTHLQLLKLYGVAPIFAIDVLKNRRKLAEENGAYVSFDPQTDDVPKAISLLAAEGGVDYAIVATGNPKAIGQAVSSVRKGGCVVLFGAPARGAFASFDLSQLFLEEVRFQSSYSTSETEMQIALDLIASKRITPTKLITHRLPLGQVQEAFQIAEKGSDSAKVIVENK